MPFINWQISEFEYSYLCSNRYLQLFQQLNTMFYESFTSFWLMREEHVRALIERNAKPSLIYPIVQRLWSYEKPFFDVYFDDFKGKAVMTYVEKTLNDRYNIRWSGRYISMMDDNW